MYSADGTTSFGHVDKNKYRCNHCGGGFSTSHTQRCLCKSPSFGDKSTKAAGGVNVLTDYNQLFKRVETVKLKHKWESDDDD